MATEVASKRTHPFFVHFNGPLPTNSISLRANHCNTQLVQHLEGSLVSFETELALKLQSTHSWGLRGDKVGRPKPDVQRQS